MVKTSAVPRRPRRTPGRPVAGAPSQRNALIDAACLCFANSGYAGCSLREIARAARVTAALTHYYFASKEGLLAAVVEERIAPLVHELGVAVRNDAELPRAALRAFVIHYTRIAAANPWLPRLIVREVLSEGGALRDKFLQKFAGELASVLRQVVAEGQRRGEFDPSLDTSHLILSLISLCIFPFLAAPLVTRVLCIDIGPASADTLARHHLAVLDSGIRGLTP